jgi:hypothetical protein
MHSTQLESLPYFLGSEARSPVRHVASSDFSLSEKISREDLILPQLLLDNLPDVPENTVSDSESEGDDSLREKKCVARKKLQ